MPTQQILLGQGQKSVPVEYLVIAGGGSGAGGGGYAGGGGGAGGYREGTNHSISGTITVTVGSGGASIVGNGNKGTDSVMADITSTKGGAGQNYTAGNITLTQGSGLTLYNCGDASTGSKTLATRGMATVWFPSGSTAYMSGTGIS